MQWYSVCARCRYGCTRLHFLSCIKSLKINYRRSPSLPVLCKNLLLPCDFNDDLSHVTEFIYDCMKLSPNNIWKIIKITKKRWQQKLMAMKVAHILIKIYLDCKQTLFDSGFRQISPFLCFKWLCFDFWTKMCERLLYSFISSKYNRFNYIIYFIYVISLFRIICLKWIPSAFIWNAYYFCCNRISP